jgi:hypothetical protein
VPFTSEFINQMPKPSFITKAKIRFHDSFLYIGVYIGGYVQEPAIWSNVTQRDEVIFQDNDFEVFINPT